MILKKLSLLLLILLWAASSYAVVPEITGVTFNEQSNILTINFDGNIMTDAEYFSIGGLTFDDDAGGLADDVVLNGGVIQNSGVHDYIDIYLLFEGIIDTYTEEGDAGMDTFDVWGVDKSRVIAIESFADKDNIELSIKENTFISQDYEPNPMMGPYPVDYIPTPDGEAPVLLDVSYEAATNTLELTFDRDIQWDSIAEDRIDPLTGVGSGQLEFGEDRNDNETLDFEANVNLLDNFGINDGMGTVFLTLDEILTLEDSPTIEVRLLADNAKLLENLDTGNLTVSFPTYTFVDTEYNTVEPVSDFALNFIVDPDPLTAVNAEYDLEDNELIVYFNRDLATGFTIVPKFMFVVAVNDTFAFQGSASTPYVTGNRVEIELLSMDQQAAEDAMYALSETQLATAVQVLVEQNAIRDDFGNYNVYSVIDPVTITYAEVAPYPETVVYDACSNIFSITFDEKIKNQPEDINFSGISVTSMGEIVQFQSILFTTTDGKKTLNLYLDPADEYNIENLPDIASIELLLEPYTVSQKGKGNGNFAVTEADDIGIDFLPDTTAPLPVKVKYNETSNTFQAEFNDAMDVEAVDVSKITYAGLTFSGTAVDFGTNPHCLEIALDNAEVSSFEGLSVKDDIQIQFAAGAFANILGTANDDLDFTDSDVLISGTDTITVVSGYGRDFYLPSRELTPTLDRTIPGMMRKTGEHCIIWVADDQWVPYDSLFIGIRYYLANNSVIPTNMEEVEIVYDFFENYTIHEYAPGEIDTLEGAYFRLNELFANDDDSFIPICNIFMCDVRDEFGLDRTAGNADMSFWNGGFFEINDQSSVFEAAGNFNTNEMDLVYLDTWPQLYSENDISWWIEWDTDDLYTQSDWEEFSFANGDPITFCNSLVNAYTKILSYKVDPWESHWMIEGMASLAELLICDNVSFYGGGTPTTPTRNALKNLDSGMDRKNDYFHAYLFTLYLYEKFGGEDLIKILSLRPTVDIASIDSALVALRDQGVSDPVLQERLELFTTEYNTRDIFSYFALACMMDTTNMAYTDPLSPLYDETIPPDNYMFQFDNVDIYGKVTGKNATGMKWDASKDPPPYYITASAPTSPQEQWSFGYYFTTYGVGLENPILSDTSVIKVFTPNDEINTFSILFKNDATENNQPNYYYEYYDWDVYQGEVSFSLNPYDSWKPGLDPTDYKCFVVGAVHGGIGKITYETGAPDYYLSVSQSSLVTNRFDVFLIASDGLWGDGSLGGGDVPQVRYMHGEQENSVSMNPNYFIVPPEDTVGVSFFSSYLDLFSSGNYDIFAFFTTLSGEEIITTPGSFTIDTYSPGSGISFGLAGSNVTLESNCYSQPVNLMISKLDYNAQNDDEFGYLYQDANYAAPPLDGRSAIGPAYNIEPDLYLDEPATVTLPYGDYLGGSSPGDIGIYLYTDGEWVYLNDPQINPANQTITVRSKQLGMFQIQAGPHGDTPEYLMVPDRYALRQNYPNPFNPTTRIDYQLNHQGNTTLKIYNIAGQVVATLVDEFQGTGFYSIEWDGKSDDQLQVASGVYLYRLESGDYTRTCKMILLK